MSATAVTAAVVIGEAPRSTCRASSSRPCRPTRSECGSSRRASATPTCSPRRHIPDADAGRPRPPGRARRRGGRPGGHAPARATMPLIPRPTDSTPLTSTASRRSSSPAHRARRAPVPSGRRPRRTVTRLARLAPDRWSGSISHRHGYRRLSAVTTAATSTTAISGRRRASASAAAARPSRRASSSMPCATGVDRLVDDERAEERGRDEAHDARPAPGQAAPAEGDRPRGPHGRGAHEEDGDDDPRGRHALLRRPTRAASEAAMIGTPGGVNGMRANAIAAPASPATIARRLRASSTSSAR